MLLNPFDLRLLTHENIERKIWRSVDPKWTALRQGICGIVYKQNIQDEKPEERHFGRNF